MIFINRKLAQITILVLLAVSIVAAPSNDPNHPLSQINPIDQDLNFSEKSIFNISQLQLSDGVIIEGNKIRNQGNSRDLLQIKDSGGIDIPRGNLSLTGGSEPNIGITLKEDSEIEFGSRLFYDSTLSDNPLRIGTIDEGNYVPAIRIDRSGNSIKLKRNLDAETNRITNVPAPQTGGDAVNRTYVQNYSDTNDDTIADDQDLKDVLSRGNRAGSNNIDLDGNQLVDGTGSTTLGGNVDVQGGKLGVGTNPSISDLHIASTGDYSGLFIEDPSADEDYGGKLVYNDSNADELNLVIRDVGKDYKAISIPREPDPDVRIPNGNLVVERGNDPTLGTYLQESSDFGARVLYDSNYTGDTSKNVLRIGTVDGGTYQPVLRADRAGNSIKLEREVQISNGDLDVKGNSVTSSAGKMCIGDQCG